MKVCGAMGLTQLLIWASVTHHASRCKLWMVVVGGGLAMLLDTIRLPTISRIC